MKVRSDFVTNSSSSSFVTMTIDSGVLAEIVKRFQLELCPDLLDGNADLSEAAYMDDSYGLGNVNVNGNIVTYTEHEGAYCDAPTNFRDSLNTFISFFDEYFASITRKGCVPKMDEEDLEEATSCDSRFAREVMERNKEIYDDIKSIDFEYSDYGWGGDSETRYYPDLYDRKTLKDIYKRIAEDLNKSIEEVTEEDFCDYVGGRASNEEYTFTYDKATGKCKHTRKLILD